MARGVTRRFEQPQLPLSYNITTVRCFSIATVKLAKWLQDDGGTRQSVKLKGGQTRYRSATVRTWGNEDNTLRKSPTSSLASETAR
jgi:hypothetical protein